MNKLVRDHEDNPLDPKDQIAEVSASTFGHIENNPPGTWFPDRRAVWKAGLHKYTMNGISWNEDGADCIVLSGGYEDDEDNGDVILYTGKAGAMPIEANSRQIRN